MKLETEWIKIIEVVGVPAVAAGGLGYLVWVLFNSLIADIHKKLDSQHAMIVALIDRVRQLDNDLIRIDAMCRSVLGMKPDVERIARADGRKDQRKD